jgi:hypothetical protein
MYFHPFSLPIPFQSFKVPEYFTLRRRIKEKLCLVVYCSPEELKRVVEKTIDTYNPTLHDSLDNVSPNDVYAGRKEAILQRRKEKKRLTLEWRREYNLNPKNCPDRPQVASSV